MTAIPELRNVDPRLFWQARCPTRPTGAAATSRTRSMSLWSAGA